MAKVQAFSVTASLASIKMGDCVYIPEGTRLCPDSDGGQRGVRPSIGQDSMERDANTVEEGESDQVPTHKKGLELKPDYEHLELNGPGAQASHLADQQSNWNSGRAGSSEVGGEIQAECSNFSGDGGDIRGGYLGCVAFFCSSLLDDLQTPAEERDWSILDDINLLRPDEEMDRTSFPEGHLTPDEADQKDSEEGADIQGECPEHAAYPEAQLQVPYEPHSEISEVGWEIQADFSIFCAYGGEIRGGCFDLSAYVRAQLENSHDPHLEDPEALSEMDWSSTDEEMHRTSFFKDQKDSEEGTNIQGEYPKHVASPEAHGQLQSSDEPYSADSEAGPEIKGNGSNTTICPPLKVELVHTGELENAQEAAVYDVDMETELIVRRMFGQKASLRQEYTDALAFKTDLYKSFDSGIPRHCALQCSTANDPGSCCWNVKRAQFREDKETFSREITALVNSFLRKEGKRVVRLPERCIAFFREWVRVHDKDAYKEGEEIGEVAKKLGLDYEQVDMYLKNFRSKKWTPEGQAGSSQRKGKYFHHRREDTARLKDWMESSNFRHPNLAERETLRKELQMTPAEILTWCYNYKNKHKKK